MYKIHKFETREQWLEWRKHGIGGSDIPKLMNCSRFGDRLDLYLEKTNKVPTKIINHALHIAADMAEEQARRKLLKEEVIKDELKPLNVELIETPHIRCSLDGYNKEGVLMEHKMLGKDNFNAVCQALNNKAQHPELDSILYQITYQAMIVKPKRIILMITEYTTKEIRAFELDRKNLPGYIKIRNKVNKLWKQILSDRT